jgi:arginase
LFEAEYPFSMFPTENQGLLVADIAGLIRKIKANYDVVGFCITESTATTLEQLDAIRPILDQIEL